VLSKCKHDILFMVHFCALKDCLNLRSKTNKRTCIKHVLPHTVTCQRVSMPSAIAIIRAAAQQHRQYNKLPNYVHGTDTVKVKVKCTICTGTEALYRLYGP